jgi:hypothetical protein
MDRVPARGGSGSIGASREFKQSCLLISERRPASANPRAPNEANFEVAE